MSNIMISLSTSLLLSVLVISVSVQAGGEIYRVPAWLVEKLTDHENCSLKMGWIMFVYCQDGYYIGIEYDEALYMNHQRNASFSGVFSNPVDHVRMVDFGDVDQYITFRNVDNSNDRVYLLFYEEYYDRYMYTPWFNKEIP